MPRIIQGGVYMLADFKPEAAESSDTFSVAIRGPHMTKKYYGPQRRRKTHGTCVNSGRTAAGGGRTWTAGRRRCAPRPATSCSRCSAGS
jgi:hypothetical protein